MPSLRCDVDDRVARGSAAHSTTSIGNSLKREEKPNCIGRGEPKLHISPVVFGDEPSLEGAIEVIESARNSVKSSIKSSVRNSTRNSTASIRGRGIHGSVSQSSIRGSHISHSRQSHGHISQANSHMNILTSDNCAGMYSDILSEHPISEEEGELSIKNQFGTVFYKAASKSSITSNNSVDKNGVKDIEKKDTTSSVAVPYGQPYGTFPEQPEETIYHYCSENNKSSNAFPRLSRKNLDEIQKDVTIGLSERLSKHDEPEDYSDVKSSQFLDPLEIEEFEKWKESKANEKERFDISDLPPKSSLIVPMLIVFFVLYIAQTFVFAFLGDNGLPWKGDEKNPLAPKLELHAYTHEIPQFMAMAFIYFAPCKKSIWELTRWQFWRAVLIGVVDLAAQTLAKNGMALTGSAATYTVMTSGGTVIVTALFARILLKKYFNKGMWFSMIVILLGICVYGYSKNGGSSTKKEETPGYFLFVGYLCILLSAVLDGVSFTLMERWTNSKDDEIPGPLLTSIMGLTNLIILLVWHCVYVLPFWSACFTKPLQYIYEQSTGRGLRDVVGSDGTVIIGQKMVDFPKDPKYAGFTYGTAQNIMSAFLFLLLGGIVVRLCTMYFLKNLGAVSFVVIKMLKVFFTVLLSSQWIAGPLRSYVIFWPRVTEVNVINAVGALLVTIGVGMYGYSKIKAKKEEQRQILRIAADQDLVEEDLEEDLEGQEDESFNNDSFTNEEHNGSHTNEEHNGSHHTHDNDSLNNNPHDGSHTHDPSSTHATNTDFERQPLISGEEYNSHKSLMGTKNSVTIKQKTTSDKSCDALLNNVHALESTRYLTPPNKEDNGELQASPVSTTASGSPPPQQR